MTTAGASGSAGAEISTLLTRTAAPIRSPDSIFVPAKVSSSSTSLLVSFLETVGLSRSAGHQLTNAQPAPLLRCLARRHRSGLVELSTCSQRLAEKRLAPGWLPGPEHSSENMR